MGSISVVLCSYNGEKYIYEQLQSIYNQSMQPDEVIIIDDNSSDSTLDIIKNFINNNNLNTWKVSSNNVNKGFRLNFIEAICQAKGDIIFLCDQDDIWFCDKISEMTKYLNDNKNVMSLSSVFEIIDSNGENIIKNVSLLNYKRNIPDNVTFKNLTTEKFYSWGAIIGCGMCFRRDIIKYMVTDLAEYKYFSHDNYINYIASIIGEVHLLNKVLFKYRIHGENTSMSNEKVYGINERIDEIYNHKIFYSKVRNLIEEHKIINIDKLKIDSVINLDCKRLNMFKEKNIFDWIKLFSQIKNYKLYTRSSIKAIKMYIADLFYMIKG